MVPYIGQIMLFGGTFVPEDWASCDGQLLNIRDNQALFALLGTTYGGDGRTTFALPNLNGRVPIGMGTGDGLTARALGASGGAETVTLAATNLPAHTHAVQAVGSYGAATSPSGARLAEGAYSTAAADSTLATDALGTTGSGAAAPTQMPVAVSLWCIALQGLFPPRS